MKSVFSPRLWTPVTVAALIVGCSSPTVRLSPSPTVSILPTTAPTATPVGATPTPGTGATATPTPAHTATPVPTATPTVHPTATPTPGSGGGGGGGGNIDNFVCTAPVEAVPGHVFSIETEGLAAGSTFVQDPAYGAGSSAIGWEYDSTTLASPTPVPTATPVATATPTVAPTVTPTPNLYNVYLGTYSLNAFSGTAIPEGGTVAEPYSVPVQRGCFEFVIEQPVGGTIGQLRAVVPSPNPNDNGVGLGFTNTSQEYVASEIADGVITGFEINNLSVTNGTGSGTFVLDTGAHGSVNIQAAGQVTESTPRRVREEIQRRMNRARLLRRN